MNNKQPLPFFSALEEIGGASVECKQRSSCSVRLESHWELLVQWPVSD